MPDNTPTQELLTIRNGRPLDEHLRELYVDRRLSDQQIADLLDVARTTIVAWRKRFNIRRSDRAPVTL